VLGPRIEGKLIDLAPVEHEYLPNFCRWSRDPVGIRYLLLQHPFTMEDEEAWYAHISGSPNDVIWAILREGRHIGNIGLHRIDWRNRSAGGGIWIGEICEHGKGFGSEAMALRTRYAFLELGLNKVIARRSNNARLNVEFAGVHAKFGRGIEGQRNDLAGWVRSRSEPDAHPVWNREIRRDQELIAGRVRVDVQPLRNAEMQCNRCRLARGNAHLLGKKVLHSFRLEWRTVPRRIGNELAVDPSRRSNKPQQRNNRASPIPIQPTHRFDPQSRPQSD